MECKDTLSPPLWLFLVGKAGAQGHGPGCFRKTFFCKCSATFSVLDSAQVSLERERGLRKDSLFLIELLSVHLSTVNQDSYK
jgi:hypothetical protein